MVPLSFADQSFLALSEAALYWPARRALLVADLHFEKASWYARFGQFLPPHDSQATLDALIGLIERTGARAVFSLGDAFHDSGAAERLARPVREGLAALMKRVDWTWISGNHDAMLAGGLPGGMAVDAMLVDGIQLRHEARADDARPEISGHFHPKFRLSVRGRPVARRCFVRGRSKLILPAFGAMTGGLDATDAAIAAAVGPDARALVVAGEKLLQFPLQQETLRKRQFKSC